MSESTPGLAYYLGQKSLEKKSLAAEVDAMTPTPLPVGAPVTRLRAPAQAAPKQKPPARFVPFSPRPPVPVAASRPSRARPQMVRGLTMSRSTFAGFCLTAFACGIVTTVAVDRIRPSGDDVARTEPAHVAPPPAPIAPALEIHEMAPPAPPQPVAPAQPPVPAPPVIAASAPAARPAAPVAAVHRQQADLGRSPEKTVARRQVARTTGGVPAPARKHASAAAPAARPGAPADAPTESWTDPFE